MDIFDIYGEKIKKVCFMGDCNSMGCGLKIINPYEPKNVTIDNEITYITYPNTKEWYGFVELCDSFDNVGKIFINI